MRQKTLTPKKKVENRVNLTAPNQTPTIRQMLNSQHAGRIEDRMKGYYEKKGEPIPDLSKLSKIEKLRYLGELRERTERLQKEANDKIQFNNNLKKQKDDELIQKQQEAARRTDRTTPPSETK